MTDRPSNHLHNLDLELAGSIDELCLRFETDWREGRRPGVEVYLGEIPDEGRPALLAELEALERELHSPEQPDERPRANSSMDREPDTATMTPVGAGRSRSGRGRTSGRRLCAGGDTLCPGHRPAAVPGTDCDGYRTDGLERRARPAAAAQCLDSARPRNDLSEVSRERPGKSVCVDGGAGRRFATVLGRRADCRATRNGVRARSNGPGGSR